MRTERAQRPRRERNAEETKRRILDAAEHEFARKGYDGARLRDVAEAAGVHHALLHHYWGDKEGVFGAVIERALGGVSTRALAILETPRDTRELIEQYVATVVDFYAEHPNLVRILHFATLDEGSPAYARCEEIAHRVLLPILNALAESIAEGQRDGVMHADIDPRRVVALCLGAAAHLFHEDRAFDLFFGGDVRAPRALAEHREAATQFIARAVMKQP